MPNTAVSSETGWLCWMDPATEGVKRLEKLAYGPRLRSSGAALPGLALPQELSFLPKSLVPAFGRLGPSGFTASMEHGILSWREAEEEYGLRAVLDEGADFGVSVLCTREPISEWERELEDFPSGEDLTEGNGYALGNINARKADASTYGYVGEDGEIQERWWCPTLLTAMYVMLYLDAREERSFPRCQREDCGQFYRLGPQDSKHCSENCASVVYTRRGREAPESVP